MVTASRVERPLSTIPNTVTVVNSVELEAQLAVHNDISTVLGNLIPSFSPSRQKMTNAGESLRGRKPLYMIDGIPQSSPLREGGRDGHIIDPAAIERIEVLHGANAIHGLGASGGIINLITKKPTDTFQQSFRADSTFQTEDVSESGDYGVAYSVSNRFGNADVLASLSLRDSGIAYDANGDVIGSDNTQGDTMDSRTLNAFLKTATTGKRRESSSRSTATTSRATTTGSPCPAASPRESRAARSRDTSLAKAPATRSRTSA